jgi:GNAT superfamily N-acetyltransferase
MIVRRLHPWEVEDVMPLAEAFHAEADVGSTFSAEIFAGTLMRNEYVAIGAFVNHMLVGVMVGVLVQQSMTVARMAQEIMWYILPEHRGNPDAAKMFDAFEDWAKVKKANVISMVSLEGNPTVTKFYRRNGYKAVETHHLKFI